MFAGSDARLGPKSLFDNYAELENAPPRTIGRPGFPLPLKPGAAPRPAANSLLHKQAQQPPQETTLSARAVGATGKKGRKNDPGPPQPAPPLSHWSNF